MCLNLSPGSLNYYFQSQRPFLLQVCSYLRKVVVEIASIHNESSLNYPILFLKWELRLFPFPFSAFSSSILLLVLLSMIEDSLSFLKCRDPFFNLFFGLAHQVICSHTTMNHEAILSTDVIPGDNVRSIQGNSTSWIRGQHFLEVIQLLIVEAKPPHFPSLPVSTTLFHKPSFAPSFRCSNLLNLLLESLHP